MDAILSAQVFSTVFGIPSGPDALFGFRFLRIMVTPAFDIWIGGIGGVVEGGVGNQVV